MDQLTELLLVVDQEHHLVGTFTDGDLRWTLKASGLTIFSLTVGEMCNSFVNNWYFSSTSGIWKWQTKYKQYYFSSFVYSCFINHTNSNVLTFTDCNSRCTMKNTSLWGSMFLQKCIATFCFIENKVLQITVVYWERSFCRSHFLFYGEQSSASYSGLFAGKAPERALPF